MKKWVKACFACLFFLTCFVVTQPGATSAWTPTSPQVSVSVFKGTFFPYEGSVALDTAGNIYTTGSFSGTVDFDPGYGIANLTSNGEDDVFVSKLDASGNYVWAKSFGGTGSESGSSVVVDSAGNIYTTGSFSGTVDFDPGYDIANLTSIDMADVFVSKLDASGNYVWAKSFGGIGEDIGNSLALDSSGNVHTAGYFYRTVDFDPGYDIANLTSPGAHSAFVSKLDASGNYVWAKSFGGFSSTNGWSVAVDSSGNVYTSGLFYGSADFDPGPDTATLTSVHNGDVFVSKLDASGNYVWAKSFGGSNFERSFGVAVDSSGNVLITGQFEGTVDFDPGPGIANLVSVMNRDVPSSSSDVFVLKLDASGNYVWAKRFGSSAEDVGNSVAVDSSGNVYITGYFQRGIDFGITNLTTTGWYEAFVAKLNVSGNSVWAKGFGGNKATTRSNSLALDSLGNVYTTGSFKGTVDFDPDAATANLDSVGFSAFVLKLNASNESSSLTPGVPSHVSATSSSNAQSVVSWTAPVYTGGAVITGYTVTSSPGGHTCVWTTGPLSCTVTGLTNGTSYTFTVTASNANGTGSASDASSSITPSATPGAPRSVTATSGTDGQSVVSWTAPVFTGGATITGYTVTSSPGGHTCVWTTGPLSCTVTGLANGTSYTFTVTAFNASGRGSASDASASITPAASQSIDFATVGPQLLGANTVSLFAVSTAPLVVTFASSTPTVCAVSGSTVTLLTTGDCTVTASQSGGPGWGAATSVSQTFTILPSPPDGEPGISINNGASSSNSRQVTLNLVWPEYATSVRISNDGGFAASKTQTKDLAPSIDWELDDSVKGVYSKVVYVRFNGVADTTKTYTDDIILDTTAPTIETSTAAIATSLVDISLKANDDITGVNKVEVRNGVKTVTTDYSTNIRVAVADLALSVLSSGLGKLALEAIELRVNDNAGNWTGWKKVTVAGSNRNFAATTSVSNAPVLIRSKSASSKSIAKFARIAVPSKSKISLKVSSKYARVCKVSGTRLRGLRVGSCRVKVTVKPPNGKSISRTVTLKVSK